MKSFILLLGLILSLSVFGQTSIYHPFPTSNATWNYKCVETSPTGSLSDALGRYSFLMTGDSTIAGVTYHKISCPAIVCDYGYCGQGIGYLGAFREDVPNKLVYYRLPNDTVETVLYDFNLNQGDTGHTANLTYRVTTVDSVLVGSGYRKRWNITMIGVYGISNYGYIIEGIGSQSSLFDLYDHGTLSGFFRWDILDCYVSDNVVLYHPDSTESCQVITSVSQTVNQNDQFKLFPNPCHSAVTLQLINPSEKSFFTLFNLFGEKVLQQKILSNTTLVDVANLEKGIYYLQITIDNGAAINTKLVIE